MTPDSQSDPRRNRLPPGPHQPGTSAADASFTQRLDRVLATAPAVQVHKDFATRVIARVASVTPTATYRRTSFGRWTIAASGAILLLAVLLLTPTAAHGSAHAILLDSALAIELAILLAWTRLRQAVSRDQS